MNVGADFPSAESVDFSCKFKLNFNASRYRIPDIFMGRNFQHIHPRSCFSCSILQFEGT
ncbi:unnamed protein product [Schistosoma curassoni]|uniref:ZP domain-containing protein n=2 Tax=Schistosoma TaxID=6181 RepID=A0A183KMN1_9TREM|nr:unnamed protein product [Schistosoma margrebowiei]VDP61300.1 unnamed protein product [Schistosoma curassoni]